MAKPQGGLPYSDRCCGLISAPKPPFALTNLKLPRPLASFENVGVLPVELPAYRPREATPALVGKAGAVKAKDLMW